MFSWLKKKKSATIAKDRLTIAIMSDRNNETYPFLDELKREIIQVVKKYIGVKAIEIKKETEGELESLSIDVQLESAS
ncbi:MAG TPA: cell division topological specificity factor MinE [Epsilonproteobacteria bacterium]|nr:cell division topological specificity factor MinE [Campylobacterota bacterium]